MIKRTEQENMKVTWNTRVLYIINKNQQSKAERNAAGAEGTLQRTFNTTIYILMCKN